MNKYQKQAALDMVKIATIILGTIAIIGYIIKLGVEANDLVAAGSFALMAYCIYQLFQIRVGQLKDRDTLDEITKKYE
mgnify:CR=1 FL=1|jgi:hypothetical protein